MSMTAGKRDANGCNQTCEKAETSESSIRQVIRRIHEVWQEITRAVTMERKPEYRLIIEEALRASGSTSANRALSAYRDEPLRLIHSSHYPTIYSALRDYAKEESNRNIEPVLAQVENVMTSSPR